MLTVSLSCYSKNDLTRMTLSRIKSFFQYHYLAITTALVILFITILVYQESVERSEARSKELFELRTNEAHGAIQRRLINYIQILRGARGFFAASDTVTRSMWANYVEMLDLNRNYPGIQGIGYSTYISKQNLEAHQQHIRAEGFTDYAVHPQGDRDAYTSIVFLEPFRGRNLRAFGFDMFSEPIRREAMQQAIDTDRPALSGKVTLVQETEEDVQPGFLIYLPLYNNNGHPTEIEERRAQIRGFIYSPFRAHDLMSTILRQFADIDIEIYDGKNISPDAVVYSSVADYKYFKAPEQNELRKKIYVTITGRPWTIFFSTKSGFGSEEASRMPLLILIGGSIISTLMFFLIWSQSNTRRANLIRRSITENATAALFMIDHHGCCTYMNQAAIEMTGYTLDELKKDTLHNMIHHTKPDGSPYPAKDCPITKVLPSQKALRKHEDVFIRKDGTYINVACSARPIVELGLPDSTVIEVRDITDEKKSQQAIIESEARFRLMAENAPVMIWIRDQDGQCIYVNSQWTDFTGIPLQDSLGMGWKAALHPDEAKSHAIIYKKHTSKKESFKFEYRLKHYTGAYRWVVTTGSPRFSAKGDFLGYIGSVIDISDRIEAERRLQYNARLLEMIFMEAPAMVALINPKDKTYILTNPSFKKLYGNKEMTGMTIYDAHPEPEIKGYLNLIETVITTQKAFIGKEAPLFVDRNHNGQLSLGYFNFVYQPLTTPEGETEALLVFAVDVTELVSGRHMLADVNKELSQKNKELVRINNDLDNFVYTASHDLKSPIANLEGLTSYLKPKLIDKLGPVELKLVDMINSSIEKLKQTITDLTEITKVQKDLQEQIEPVQFEETLNDVITDIKGMVTGAKANITTDFQVASIPYARKNLRSIIYNLLSNAIKYSAADRKAEIHLSTKHAGEYTILTCSDNGLGIKPDQLPKLFTMFQRLHNHVEGTGIGLYIVKRIIENNEGKIEVESTLNVGTTFRVYFSNAISQKEKEEKNPASFTKKTIPETR
jgi:PAS domain S-box-containing protein